MPSDRPPSPLSSPLAEAVRAVAEALSAIDAPGMIIGGIAVIARGVPRLTRDVDVTVAGAPLSAGELLEQLDQRTNTATDVRLRRGEDERPSLARAEWLAQTDGILTRRRPRC